MCVPLYQIKKKKTSGSGGNDRYDSGTNVRLTPSPLMIPAAGKGPKRKTRPVGSEHSSVFFGHDLPDDITEDEILSFLNEFKHSIVTVEVVLNEKSGNYAKVTFATHSDACAAMKHYNHQPWYDMGVNVTMKPWKGREESTSLPKKHVLCK